MAGLGGEPIRISSYNPSGIDFDAPIKAALGLDPEEALNKLHKKFKLGPVVSRETDSKTVIHQRYYEHIGNTDFSTHYKKFIHEVVTKLVGSPIIVQKVPTFRAHLPGNKAVGEYHRDRDFGHQTGAINFWVPVTNAYDTNTVYVAESQGGVPTPINVMSGEILAFDGVNLLHGNEINETEDTRVSFDFRVIPERDYVESHELSINTQIRLAIGDYYTLAQDL